MSQRYFSRIVFAGFTLLSACSQDNGQQQSAPAPAAPTSALAPTDSAVPTAAPARTMPAPAALPGAMTVQQLLQGKWQSTTDKKDVVEFNGHDYIDYYDQELLSRKPFVLDKACPREKAAGAAGDNERYLVVEDMCWRIAVVDDTSLELEYVEGGKILVYSKIK